MKRFKACYRLAAALVHALTGLLTIILVFPRLTVEQRQMRVQVWSLAMLGRLGIALRVVGQPAVSGPMLLVANHISWLDITAMHAARYCRFVSKSDIRQWPLIGALAAGVGTLFIERASRRDAMRVVHQVATSLQDGEVVAIFPEGTTSDGNTVLAFHANLIESAIAVDAPVQPVALCFVDRASGQPTRAPCYINDDTLAGSVWRTLTAPSITAVLTFGESQCARGRDRRTWAADLREEVIRLREPRKS